MKIKFNKFERVAGVFVLTAMTGLLASAVTVAFQRGWFESKVELATTFRYGDGLFPGMPVQMSGLRAGAVDDVILESDNKVTVRFHVSERFFDKIRKDSLVRTIRPFIIGDKAIDISIGSMNSEPLIPGSLLTSEETIDLMDILGGRRMSDAIKTISALTDNLKVVLDAFNDPNRTRGLVEIFDSVGPLLKEARVMSREMTNMSKQMTTGKSLERTLNNAVALTTELNRVLPKMTAIMDAAPDMGPQLIQVVQNLSKLTDELTKVLPALTAVAPELPRASQRAIEAMDEAVIVLKAMQKTFLLSGSVKEVREEEKHKAEAQQALKSDTVAPKERSPANESK